MKKNIFLTGHSHIDAVWLWDVEETKKVCKETFVRILDILDNRDDFVYMQSSAQFYKWMETENPDIFKRIKKHVETGKWELVGGMWVESDCNLPSGESLIRQFLYGQKYFMNKFNIKVKTAIMPDTFGYAWTLPQIMKGSEIEYFLTSKINWETTLQFPHCLFWWEGLDGTEILSLATPTGYVNTSFDAVKRHIKMTSNMQENLDDIFVPYGEGDHGGGLSNKMIDDVYNKDEEVFNVKYTSIDNYFESVKEKYGESLPQYSDELYLKTHRGTYSSQGIIKKFNREIECKLDIAEKISVLSNSLKGFSQKEEIEKNWEKVLFHQFHDDLPGSAISKVYEDDKKDFKEIRNSVGSIINNSFDKLLKCVNIKEDNSIVVFNPHAFRISSEIRCKIPKEANLNIVNKDEEFIDSIIINENGEKYIVFSVNDLPSLGYEIFYTKDINEETINNNLDVFPLENKYYSFSFSKETGLLNRLLDKERNVEVFKGENPMQLIIYDDITPLESAWNINLGKRYNLQPEKTEVEENNSYRTIIKSSFNLKEKNFNNSTVVIRTIINNTNKNISYRIDSDWKEKMKTLKLSFSINTSNRNYDYEIPYGSITRRVPTDENISAEDKAKWEVPGQKWVSVVEKDHRISLLNDSKYGYDTRNGLLKITLLRSAVVPKPLNKAFEKNEKEYTDRGMSQINLSLIVTDIDKKDVFEKAYLFNEKPIAKMVNINEGKLSESNSFIEFTSKNSILTTAKEAEDKKGIIFRIIETDGRMCSAEIKLDIIDCEKAYETNLIENIIKEVPIVNDVIHIDLKPHEIKTIYIR